MIHKALMLIAIRNLDFLKYYNFVKKMEFQTIEKLKEYQEKKLRNIIQFCYDNISYYRRIFKSNSLKVEDIHSIEDLIKLPILTKDIIRKYQKDFIHDSLKNIDYFKCTTGGSTGSPLHYLMSKNDQVLGTAIKYANWGYAGYKLGDKFVVVAGTQLIPTTGSKSKNKIRSYFMNRLTYSSFNLNYDYMKKIIMELNRFKPKYIRGYASSIYLYAKFLNENDMNIEFKINGIFTTAEILPEYQRKIIEKAFDCKVFDHYGLNDGGVSSYECRIHNGLHIDMIRSIMEIVDENGNQQKSGAEGKILATSLHNYAFPFIRYDTGDIGILSDIKCECGRNYPVLKKIVGRTTDYLKFRNGAIIGAPILTVLFGKYDIIQYQIIQSEDDRLLIYIIKGPSFSKDNEEEIRKIFYKHIGNIDIEIKYVNKIQTTDAGKWKFIVRKTGE